jgi:hypothetical protein
MRLPQYTVLADARIEFSAMVFEAECLIESCELIGRPAAAGQIGRGTVFQGEIGKVSILNCILRGTAADWFAEHWRELQRASGNIVENAGPSLVAGDNLLGRRMEV